MTETQAVDFLVQNGYHALTIKENVVSADLLLIHPDTIKALRDSDKNSRYIFIITHTRANEWCDNFHIRKYKKLAKKYYPLVEWY